MPQRILYAKDVRDQGPRHWGKHSLGLVYNGFEGTLTRLTQIVENNDDIPDNGVCGSDSDEPSEHESMDDGETSGDDNIIGKDAALVACSVSHPSMKIPYLDNTEESTEDFAYTRDDSSNQASLWNFKNLEFIQISWPL
ncbi:hypothetical protein FXO38_16671 [Capsicum annuum]|nr:hypothetical protein FXO38_16671 [Capsicum annuum]